ncbi:phosphoglycerate kinase [Flavobacteriales bacterium]|jgi:phosphoglycerate kinase|nr:phosphoglycerate kinase [Flavobacteriales bacterium]
MTLDNLSFQDKRALIRVDFNVPMDADYNVTDDTRMRATLPTITKIINEGGKVILMSHRGRPKGTDESLSMKHLVSHLSTLLSKEVKFINECVGEEVVDMTNSLKSGDVLLIENLRFYKEETAGDVSFAQELSKLGDIYINDAFGTAHRAHASTAIIAQFFDKNKCFGYVMSNEIENINKVTGGAKKPFTAIVGGAKVSSKISIILRLMDEVDNLIIGGGMTFTFIKAKGGHVGNSLVEDDKLDLAIDIIQKAKEKGVNLYLPTDSVNADKFDNEAKISNSSIENIPSGYMGLDIGQETAKQFSQVVLDSSTVLWNGPMGVFEMENFSHGTKAVADALSEATQHGTYTLVGGGDSVAAINKYGLADKVSYVSTGGGAMLEYLEGKVLPGIAAILED